MAIVTVKEPSSLKIRFNHGSDTNGKLVIRSKTFPNVKPDATSDALYAVAKSIASLQDHDIYEVIKLDNTSLSE